MLQSFVLNVLSVFPTYAAYVFHTYDVSVLSRYYVCLQWFQLFSGVFASVSDSCFRCFICFQTYVAFVASECFKTRSYVVSSSSPFYCLNSVSDTGRWRWSPLVRGRTHMLADGRNRRDVDGPVKDTGRGAATHVSGHPDARYVHTSISTMVSPLTMVQIEV